MTHALSDTYQAAIETIRALLDSTSASRPDGVDVQTYLPITSEAWMAFMAETDVGRRGRVQRIQQRRLELLSSRNVPLPSVTRRRPDGRFLAYDPDGSLSDGAAMAATSGFYSFDNAPPGVLWLDYIVDSSQHASAWAPFSAYVLIWAPDELIALANTGIEVNVERCLRWLS
jgi:hypothetical protein